jgi:hypothetical protein
MRERRSVNSVSILLVIVSALGATACAAQTTPAVGPYQSRQAIVFLSLLPELAARTLEGTQPSRPLAVDVESFQAGAVLFARARLSHEQITAAFGRPLRDMGLTALRSGELPTGAMHLALDAMIDLGAYIEATVTVSWSAAAEAPAGQRTVRLVFVAATNGYRFESLRPLVVT